MTEQATQPARRVSPQVLHTLPVSPVHPCAYLPGQVARDRGFAVHRMEPQTWQEMLEAGWRRSGMTIYQPACPFCTQCRSIRIPVGAFNPDRTMRRLQRTNGDLECRLTRVTIDDDRFELYQRYITTRHDGLMTGSRREFELFLGQSPVDTCELELRLDGRLVSVGTIDRAPGAWSCVYCYYDPQLPKRSLGTFNILSALALCRSLCPAAERARLYLGYWVAGSKTMEYKARFRPHEVLSENGIWKRGEEWSRSAVRPRVEIPATLRIQEGSVSTAVSSP